MSAPQRQRRGLVGVLRGPFGVLWAGQSVSSLGELGSCPV